MVAKSWEDSLLAAAMVSRILATAAALVGGTGGLLEVSTTMDLLFEEDVMPSESFHSLSLTQNCYFTRCYRISF